MRVRVCFRLVCACACARAHACVCVYARVCVRTCACKCQRRSVRLGCRIGVDPFPHCIARPRAWCGFIFCFCLLQFVPSFLPMLRLLAPSLACALLVSLASLVSLAFCLWTPSLATSVVPSLGPFFAPNISPCTSLTIRSSHSHSCIMQPCNFRSLLCLPFLSLPLRLALTVAPTFLCLASLRPCMFGSFRWPGQCFVHIAPCWFVNTLAASACVMPGGVLPLCAHRAFALVLVRWG